MSTGTGGKAERWEIGNHGAVVRTNGAVLFYCQSCEAARIAVHAHNALADAHDALLPVAVNGLRLDCTVHSVWHEVRNGEPLCDTEDRIYMSRTLVPRIEPVKMCVTCAMKREELEQ